jgi:hypothetical protein
MDLPQPRKDPNTSTIGQLYVSASTTGSLAYIDQIRLVAAMKVVYDRGFV